MPDAPTLVLKSAKTSRPSCVCVDEDYDVLSEGEVVGRIFKGKGFRRPWFWAIAYGHHRDRNPSHGYEPTGEAAIAAFRKSWLRE